MNPLIKTLNVELPSSPPPVAAQPVRGPLSPLRVGTQRVPQICNVRAVATCDTPALANHGKFIQILSFTRLLCKGPEIAEAEKKKRVFTLLQENNTGSLQLIEDSKKSNKLKELYFQCVFLSNLGNNRDENNQLLGQRYFFMEQYHALFCNVSFNIEGKLLVKNSTIEIGSSITRFVKRILWTMDKHFGGKIPPLGILEEDSIAIVHNRKIFLIHVLNKIGKGGQATVYKVFEYATAKFYALKMNNRFPEILDLQERDRRICQAANEIKQEARILQFLENKYGREQPWFVQAPFLMVAPGGRIGYLGRLYTCDFFDLCTKQSISPQQAILFSKQIMEGAFILHRLGIWYGDYKLENIFLDQSDGTPRARIADLGGARFFAELNLRNFEYATCTLNYMNAIDFKKMQVAVATGLEEGSETAKANIIALANQQVVFALGVTFYSLLAGYRPYELEPLAGFRQETTKFGAGFNRKLLEGAGHTKNEPLMKLLAGMLDHDATKRMTMEQAAKAWSEIHYIASEAEPATASAATTAHAAQ